MSAAEKQKRLTKYTKDGKFKASAFARLERITKSSLVTKTIEKVQQSSRTTAADVTKKYSRSLLTKWAPPKNIEVLEVTNEDEAFRQLSGLPGLENGQAELSKLRRMIAVWRAQGSDLHDKSTQAHAAVLTDTAEAGVKFAKHYHAYMKAVGIVPAECGLVEANAGSYRSMWSIDALDDGLCLVANANKLCQYDAEWLNGKMQSKNIVMVLSYTGTGQQLHGQLDQARFGLVLIKEKETVGNQLESVIDVDKYVKSWFLKKYEGKDVRIEGGFDGPWVGSFSKKVLNDSKEKNIKVKTLLGQRLEKAQKHQFDRIVNHDASNDDPEPDPLLILKEDILGDAPAVAFDSPAWQDLDSMIGLDQVKAAIHSYANGVLLDYHRAIRGNPPIRSGLSRMFLGPPGTGKTEVAHLYAKILCSLDVLDDPEVISIKASDLIGRYLGQSEDKTNKALDGAKGKVLIIDEAYQLDPEQGRGDGRQDPYRKGVLDTIVGKIDNSPKDRRCVILAGYREEMLQMLKTANVGLARRFPVEDAFEFQAFDNEMLGRVLDAKLGKDNITTTPDARLVALDALNLQQHKSGRLFGNGGAVTNLIGRAMGNYRTRFGKMTLEQQSQEVDTCLQPEDFDPEWRNAFRTSERVPELFEGMLGLEKVQDRFVSLAHRVTALKEAGNDPRTLMPFHFVFLGPQGCGKTIMASKMGWLFKSMRLIGDDEIVTCSAKDLIERRLSGDSRIFMQQLTKATGKVLVIDEAHNLSGDANDHVDAAIQALKEEILQAVSHPDHRERTVVILAGQETLLRRLLDSHRGLSNRFGERLHFPGVRSTDCWPLLQKEIEVKSVTIRLQASDRMAIDQTFEKVCRSDDWANYKGIQAVAREVLSEAFEIAGKEGHEPVIERSTVLTCLEKRCPPQTQGQRGMDMDRLRDPTSMAKNLIRSSPSTPRITGAKPAIHPQLDAHEDDVGPNSEVTEDSLSRAISASELYQYSRLPIGRYVRVLRLQPSVQFQSAIECTLETICLDDPIEKRPGFDALSYCWDGQERTKAILCDGKIMMVTRNCQTAMRYLRGTQSPYTLWVDAICIDQKYVPEKNQQVSLMGDIYQSCRRTIVWLDAGSLQQTMGVKRVQKLSCVRGSWGEHEHIRTILARKYYDYGEYATALNTVMKQRWWRRMWTFQEFVISERLIFAIGHTRLSWEDFEDSLKSFGFAIPNAGQKGAGRKASQQLQGAVINQLLPQDLDRPGEIDDFIRWYPIMTEVIDAVACRQAYHQRDLDGLRPLIMSHFLLKTRNRDAFDSKDKVYGLYHLFQSSGYTLPPIDYKRPVAEVYTGVALSLLQQSGSWWMLSHLFNKRAASSIALPSWVPDFSSHAVWHQAFSLRAKSIKTLSTAIEKEEKEVEAFPGPPFLVKEVQGGLVTSAVFLWEVTECTTEMPSNPTVNRSFDETFERTDFRILQDALEDFFFILGGWLKVMQSHSNAVDAEEVSVQDQNVLLAIAWTFARSEVEHEPGELRDSLFGMPVPETDVLVQVLRNVRACICPDAAHPCRICGTTQAHKPSIEAVDHFNEWIKSQGFWLHEYLRFWLYSRAVDHALFRTGTSGSCPGHFGFCRNLPRPGDQVVLLRGLSDPVIVRKEKSGCYSAIGVTSGMVGAKLEDRDGKSSRAGFCTEQCPILVDVDAFTVQEIQLV